MALSRKSKANSSTARNLKPCDSNVEIVGHKTRGELEADWLNHFQKNTTPRGRPEGGFTSQEMSEKAGTNRQAIERYVKANPKRYDRVVCLISYPTGERRTSFYVFKG